MSTILIASAAAALIAVPIVWYLVNKNKEQNNEPTEPVDNPTEPIEDPV